MNLLEKQGSSDALQRRFERSRERVEDAVKREFETILKSSFEDETETKGNMSLWVSLCLE